MLKVIIVDDEIIVRVGLKACISWEELGYEVVGTAEDGAQALNLVEYMRPDVVFTDICMPGMDGLELIRSLHNSYPETKIIVLSCLNEIEHVKQAMKLGAEDYILKLSLKSSTLIEILNNLKAQIEKERMGQNYMVEESFQNRYFSRIQLYQRILSNTTSPDDQSMLMDSLNISQQPGESFIIFCCTIDYFETAQQQSSLTEHYLFKFAILNIINEFLSDFSLHETIDLGENEYLILVRFHISEDIANLLKISHKNFNDAINKHLNITASWGVSAPFEDLHSLPLKWKHAKAISALRFFQGASSLLFSGVTPEPGCDKANDIDISLGLNNAITSLSKDNVFCIVNDWEVLIRNSKCISPSSICATAVEARISVSHLMKGHGLDERNALTPQIVNESLSILQTEFFEDLCNYLKTFASNCIDIIEQNKSQRLEIIGLKQYIVDHLDENITLEEAARICNFSRAYFSSIFKKSTGENFLCYINRTKMEKARDLIAINNLHIYEAALQVGISDQSHFGKLFRKYIGINPSNVKHVKLPIPLKH